MNLFLLLLVLLGAGVILLFVAPKGWRTMVLHGSVAVLAGAGEIINLLGGFDWHQVLDPSTAAIVILALGILGVVYRLVTTGPVGSKAAG